MAGFRLWEGITIDDLLKHLEQVILTEVTHEYGPPSAEFNAKVVHAMKRVLNHDMYASPACGTSSLCSPSEEGRVKPWSRRAKDWGLVAQADPTLDKDTR
jgi:uncharacterized radical SAM superfamily Fe-S cluster-containing enzyme